jgi:flagellar biosynthesis chaperone FliJ
MAEADGELQRIDRQLDNLGKDQERIRQNIRSLNGVAGQEQQVQGYARQLAAQEAQIAGLRDRQAEQQRTKTSLEGELNRAIETAAF